MIHRVPATLTDDFWPLLSDRITEAIAYHEFMDAADVRFLLLNGACQLFIATQGAAIMGFAVMEVIHYPSRKVANVFLSGGDKGFLPVAVNTLLPELQQWADEQDADDFAILGARPGWVRALRSKGFSSATHVTLWTDCNVERRRQRRQHTTANDDQRAVERGTAVH